MRGPGRKKGGRLGLPAMLAAAGRLVRGERGAAAVEFAIIAPLLIALVLGIVQFGAIFYVWHNMTATARDTARRVAIGEITTQTGAEAFATQAMGGIVPWVVGFRVAASLPAGANPSGGDVTIVITAPLVQAAIVDFLGILGEQTLRARALMRVE